MPDSDPIALIDLDGTVADFDGAMRAGLEKLAMPGEDVSPEALDANRKLPYMRARRRLIKSQQGFWRNLPVLECGMEDVVDTMRRLGFRLVVLTKGPQRTTGAWTEKVEWAQEHIPDASVCIVEGREDKGLVYGRVLFDDWPDYIEAWLKWRPRGLVIMTDQLWNRDFEHPNVFRFNGPEVQPVGDGEDPNDDGMGPWRAHLAELEAKLIEARDR
jgi:hypothetical protein